MTPDPLPPPILALGLLAGEPREALRAIRALRRLRPEAVLRVPPAIGPSLLEELLAVPAAQRVEAPLPPGSGAWLVSSDAFLVPRFDATLLTALCVALEEGIPVLIREDEAARRALGHAALYLPADARWPEFVEVLDRCAAEPGEPEAVIRRGRAWARHLRRQLDTAAAPLPLPSRLPRHLPPGGPCPPAPPAPPAERFERLSIVLALHGRRELTEDCLATLRADLFDLEPDQEAEIICVDNASPDDTREWLLRQPELHRVLLAENRGCPGGWNAGLRAATGDLLCVLNNDTRIHLGGIRALAKAAWETGIAAMVGGKLNERFEFAGMTENPDEADYPDGCALAFRRDVWEAVGPFDEGMGLGYCEDSDWGLRARTLGYRFALVPRILTHLGGQTSGTLPEVTAGQRRNQERLRWRWRDYGVGERIVVRRWGALGDLVLATPVLAALREAKPLARIVLECAPDLAEAFQGLPGVNEVVSSVTGAVTRRIDLDGAYEGLEAAGEWRHPTLLFAEWAGVGLREPRYLAPETPEWAEWARELLPDLRGHRYVACGLRSAFRPKVNWSEQGWLELARAAPELTFVALDGDARPSLEARGEHGGESFWDLPNVVDLTGRTRSFRPLMALLRRCMACVSVDSGMWHLAAAVSLPTVGLVGAGAGWSRAPLVGRHRVLQGQAPCYPCRNPSGCSREDGPHCLARVEGIQVADTLRELLRSGVGG